MAFEFDAERYEKASTHQQEWGSRLITELDLAGSERILDIGCGNGRLTSQIADRVPGGYVVGIDASSAMIEAARPYERANLTFLLQDITQSRFEGEFEVVISNATLHWIHDHSRLLRIVHRALKDGGVLRANFAAEGNCATLIRVVRAVMATSPFWEVLRDFQWPWCMHAVEEYQELLRQSPFRSFRVWGESADRYFPDRAALVGWIEQPSLVPFRQHLSSELGDRFRDAVVERMLTETAQTDGTFFETFRRIHVLAQK